MFEVYMVILVTFVVEKKAASCRYLILFYLSGYGFKKKFYPEVRSEMGRILDIMNRQGDKSHSIVQYCLVMDRLTLSEIVLRSLKKSETFVERKLIRYLHASGAMH